MMTTREQQTEVVKVYVTPEMKQLIADEANKVGISMSSILVVAFAKLIEDYEYVPNAAFVLKNAED